MDAPHRARALRAVARHRAVGLHFVGHFLGAELLDQEPGRARLRLDRWDAAVPRGPHPLELGVLADLAMGHAVRAGVRDDVRLATTSLTLHRGSPSTASSYVAVARVAALDPERRLATAAVDLHADDGTPVGLASASFALLPSAGQRVSPVDWSALPDLETLPDLADLDDEEAAAVAAVEDAARSGDLLDALLATGGGTDHVLVSGPHLENRVGHLQGGVAHALVTATARRLLDESFAVADARVQYLRPARRGPVTVRAEVVRRGRTTAFVRVVLSQQDREVAEGTVTLAAG